MPSHRPAVCRICNKGEDEVGRISWRGKCLECGLGRQIRNALALHGHNGPEFDHWRQRGAAGYGAVILDKPKPSRDTDDR